MAERVLIVDDDPVARRLVENMVSRAGYVPVTADGGDLALAMLADGAAIDCVILDLVMPDLDGLGVLAKMRAAGIGVPVIVQTAHGGLDSVISAMRGGAVDFVVKPVGAERLTVSLRNALVARALEGELNRIKRSQSGTLTFRDVVTRSARMLGVLRTAEKAAASSIAVLIEGESGVGKELIARAIHGSGGQRAKPFVAVNCGAIPQNLVDSTLFGQQEGACTGAAERHAGKFVEASGGTLFLDEVGELPLATQVTLMHALQEGEIHPVGGKKPIKADVRIISATDRDLIAEVRAGRFREDLYDRLCAFSISVPPLRARPEDIPHLIRHFLLRFAAEHGKRVRGLSAEALALLTAFPWPGNVRQLENAIFRAVVLAEGDEIGVAEFPQIAAASESPLAPYQDADVRPAPCRNVMQPLILDKPAPAGHANPPAGATLRLLDNGGDVLPLDAVEAAAIRFAIAHYRGHMSEVARRLRIGRSTLYRKLDQLGLAASAGKEDVADG